MLESDPYNEYELKTYCCRNSGYGGRQIYTQVSRILGLIAAVVKGSGCGKGARLGYAEPVCLAT